MHIAHSWKYSSSATHVMSCSFLFHTVISLQIHQVVWYFWLFFYECIVISWKWYVMWNRLKPEIYIHFEKVIAFRFARKHEVFLRWKCISKSLHCNQIHLNENCNQLFESKKCASVASIVLSLELCSLISQKVLFHSTNAGLT